MTNINKIIIVTSHSKMYNIIYEINLILIRIFEHTYKISHGHYARHGITHPPSKSMGTNPLTSCLVGVQHLYLPYLGGHLSKSI